jgi:hypothetical protein
MRYLTAYRSRDDGDPWDGPQLEADSLAAAEALLCCVFGPGGERLTVIGIDAGAVAVETPRW